MVPMFRDIVEDVDDFFLFTQNPGIARQIR